MLIIFGTHVSRKCFGPTHLFCPLCHGVRRGDLTHHVRMPHIYWIPFWRTVLPVLSCKACGLTLRVPKALRPVPVDAPELVARTQLEERLLANRLDWQQRKELMTEPIAALDFECMQLSERPGDVTLTTAMQWLAVVTVCGSICSGYLYFSEPRPPSKAVFLPYFIGFLMATIVSIGLAIYFTSRKHFGTARDLMTPRIAKSLSRMRPKREEIEEVLADLRRKGNKISKAVSADDICDAISARQNLN